MSTYNFIVWPTGSLTVIIAVLLDHFGIFMVGYGKVGPQICWIRSIAARVVFYMVPCYTLLLFNMLIIVLMLCKLRGDNLDNATRSSQRNLTFMALKLILVFGVL